MTAFESFSGPIANLPKDPRSKKTLENLLNKMYKKQNCQIWKLSDDRKEYERYSYLLEKPDGHGVSAESANEELLSRAATALKGNPFTVIVHDGSSIRKGHSREMEGLALVRGLDGELVPGYSTFNSVAVEGSNIHLLSCTPYSTEEEGYDGKLSTQGSFSAKSIVKDQLASVSAALKGQDPDRALLHIIDRGEDDNGIFDFIANTLGDRLVIRMKLSRNSGLQAWCGETQRGVSLKIAKTHFANGFEQRYEVFSWRGRGFAGARACVEYETFRFGANMFNVVRVQMYDAGGRKLFAEPMLLVTNLRVTDRDSALRVFHLYLKRSKIEGVFKFLKTQLGWEEFRVRDLMAIKHIVSLCYFIGAYFYELEPELTHDPYMRQICRLGGGKDKVTRHFFLKGLEKMYGFQEVSRFIEEHGLTPEDVQNLMKRFGL